MMFVVSVNMYSKLIIFITAVCYININGEPMSGNPPLTKTEKLISNGINLFAVQMLKTLHHGAGPPQNILFSPTNIYQALAVLHLASNGSTRHELAQIMSLPQDDKEVTAIHTTLSQITRQIQNKSANPQNVFSEVNMATGLFLQKNFLIKDDFVKLVQEYYNGNVSNLDFKADPKKSTDAINQWISKKTKNRISKLYTQPLDRATLTVLTSSLYFNGKWENPFPKLNTKQEKFNTGCKEIQIPMMRDQQMVLYVNTSDWQSDAIVLPYAGREYHMLIILPHSTQTLKNLTDHLDDADKLHGIVMKSQLKAVDYKIPRMKFLWNKEMETYLSNLGLNTVFKNANFDNMVSLEFNLTAVSGVNHAAEIEVDELGTNANAVTGVQLIPSLDPLPKNPIPFHVNKAFWFCIYYQPKHVILFTAVVYNPHKSAIKYKNVKIN